MGSLVVLLALLVDFAGCLETGGSTLPPIITPPMRELVLREVHSSLKKESPHAEWHTRRAEWMLAALLSQLESAGEVDDKARRGTVAHTDLEAMWLLCRSQLGCIEAVLKELGDAYERVGRVRQRWQRVSGPSLSLATNHAVSRAASRLRHLVHTRLGSARVAPGGNGGSSGDVGGEVRDAVPSSFADEAGTPADGKGGSDPPAEPLGGGRTRIGLGTRRRALLRSERALACHAGALHDLRVALREAGGEWLELGRWVGGPPLASMPWDVQPCKQQQEQLLLMCARTQRQLRSTADALRRLGPYALYSEAFPGGAAASDVEPLAARRGVLVSATRDALDDLWAVRRAVKLVPAPPALRPPNLLARHSIIWLSLLALLVHGYARWLPMLLAIRHDALRAGMKAATDGRRFWHVHVTEPLKGIATELFHGYESTIEKEQVEQTRQSLARMLKEFVKDTHASSARASDLTIEEALEQAGQGSMESVTTAFESQVMGPLTAR